MSRRAEFGRSASRPLTCGVLPGRAGFLKAARFRDFAALVLCSSGNNGQQLLAPIDLDDGNGRQKSIALDIYIVTFTHRVREFEAFHSGSMFAEFLDPIRAIVNARVQRGIETLELSKLAFKNGITILPVVLGDSAFTPPLGLVLSPSALERIERRSGFHELTAIEKLGESAAGWRSVEENNASAHKLWEITK